MRKLKKFFLKKKLESPDVLKPQKVNNFNLRNSSSSIAIPIPETKVQQIEPKVHQFEPKQDSPQNIQIDGSAFDFFSKSKPASSTPPTKDIFSELGISPQKPAEKAEPKQNPLASLMAKVQKEQPKETTPIQPLPELSLSSSSYVDTFNFDYVSPKVASLHQIM